jgi:hypothetical protein
MYFCKSLFVLLYFFFWILNPFIYDYMLWYLCACYRIVMSNAYCVVFLFCFSSSCVPYVAPPVLVGFALLDLQFYMYFCKSLFVLLYFFFWPLCCLFFFDIRIPIAPLVSSNSSFSSIVVI